jgi:hypothetical protein
LPQNSVQSLRRRGQGRLSVALGHVGADIPFGLAEEIQGFL